MTVFIQNDATGAGGGNLDPNQAAVDLAIIANGDTGLGLAAAVGNRQQVTYAQTLAGPPPNRLSTLVNTNFNPNYGGGAQNVNVILLPVLANFMLNDGTSILVVGGTALPPQGSGLAGANLNNTNDCLVIYDTTQNNGSGYCTARAGTGGTLDLATPNPVILYHELSHAFRIVTNALLALTAGCNPSSPEENAAITDENDLRNQIAAATGSAAVLRDPGIHCGTVCSGGGGGGGGGGSSCCIIASVASGSPLSQEVAALRAVRDGLVRRSEVGFALFQRLHFDYYAFSPQVCVLMARHPALQPFVLEGFVRPLVGMLGLMRLATQEGGSAETLGHRFAADHADVAASATRLRMLARAEEVLRSGDPALPAPDRELAQLLLPALESGHVAWALIEPVRIYRAALESHLRGESSTSVGELLYTRIDAWAAQLPLDDVWAALTPPELEEELRLLDRVLLPAAGGRAKFRRRLAEQFGSITAVARALGTQAERDSG